MQKSFSDLEYAAKKKLGPVRPLPCRNRQRDDLGQAAQAGRTVLSEGHWCRSSPDRLASMLRMYVTQQFWLVG
jgi:hypothetical protein